MKRDSRAELNEVSQVQASMVDAIRSCFSPAQLDALRVVIRLTVEFHKSVEANNTTNYVSASVFSGISSFLTLVHSYAVLEGAEIRSQLQWNAVSVPSIKQEFELLYPKFIAEKNFEKQCRLLLDLFKLQLALAAMTFDCDND